MAQAQWLIPILAMLGFSCVVAGAALCLGAFLGPKRYNRFKLMTYECGITPTGGTGGRISVKYYLVAILFLLFDLEAAFLLPVALVWKNLVKIGPLALGSILFFLFFFLLGLWYEFKVKALEWEQ